MPLDRLPVADYTGKSMDFAFKIANFEIHFRRNSTYKSFENLICYMSNSKLCACKRRNPKVNGEHENFARKIEVYANFEPSLRAQF